MSAGIAELEAWYQAFVGEQQRKNREMRDAAIKKALDDGIRRDLGQSMVKGERALLVRQMRGRFGSVPSAQRSRGSKRQTRHTSSVGETLC